MANAIWSKDGVEFKETPDTPEFSETAKSKGYKRYYDITKDDKDVKTVPEDMLETAKAKGYKIFGQPAIEEKPAAPTQKQAAPTPKPVEEPGLLDKATDWASRAGGAAIESVKGLPAGLMQLGKEVTTQPLESLGAAGIGLAKTTGLYTVPAAVAGGLEAGKALVSGEKVGEAFKKGYEEEKKGFMEAAEGAKEIAPASYAAAPYVAVGAATAGAGLPVVLGAEALTGAAQQYAETGKIDTAELAGQTLAGLGLTKGAQKAAQLAERVSPIKVTAGGKAAKAASLEQAAIEQAQKTGGIGDVAKKYTGEGAIEKINEAKRAGYEVSQLKEQIGIEKMQLDSEHAAKRAAAQEYNSKVIEKYTTDRANAITQYNELTSKIEAENAKGAAADQSKLAQYNIELEAWNQEVNKIETAFQDAQKQHQIELANFDRKRAERAKELDEGFLGKREQYYTEELPEFKKQQQKDVQARQEALEKRKIEMTEWHAEVKKGLNDLKTQSNQLYKQSIEKAKEARKSLKGEAITAMGDELRGMLDNMDEIQKNAYETRKAVSDASLDLIDNVDDSATAKAIFDVEKSLNSHYMLDDAIREDLKAIRMRVNPEFQASEVTRGMDFEAMHELRIYLDSLKKNVDAEAAQFNRMGASELKEITRKRNAINEARRQIQQRLYGADSPFSPELKQAGEAADGIFSEFNRAKKLMIQKGLLAREKAVPGIERGIEPRTSLIRDYFDELDAGRKTELKDLLSEFGVDTAKLDELEKNVRLGVVPEPIAIQRLELPERPGPLTLPASLAQKPIPPLRPLPSQYDIGVSKPAAPLKPVMPPKPIKPITGAEQQRIPKFVPPPKPALQYVPESRPLSAGELEAATGLRQQRALAAEYRALGGQSTFDERGIPLSKEKLTERLGEAVSEATGVGTTPMQKLERAAEIRATPVLFERLQAKFAEKAPNIPMSFRVLTNQGVKITPALIRSIAQRNNVSEEEIAEAIVESQTP